MSISFCVIWRASLGLDAVVTISNRLSCCAVTLMFCDRLDTRSATSRSFETVFARSVPRTTLDRFVADVSVWRIVSRSFCASCGGPSTEAGSIDCICTKMRACDSYRLGICATTSQPSTHTPQATPSAIQRRVQMACSASRASS